MEKNNSGQIIIRTSIVLGVICAVLALCLAFVYNLTFDKIEENKIAKIIKAQKAVLSANSYEEIASGDEKIAKALDVDGNIIGYCVDLKIPGYGGDIEIMVGVNPQLSVTGLEIISHSETPGLGANIAKDDYKNSYVGTTVGDEVDTITGATISSESVNAGVTKAINLISDLAKPEVPDELLELRQKVLPADKYEDVAVSDTEMKIKKAIKDSSVIGYCVEVSSMGHKDNIYIMVGVDNTVTVTGIEIIKNNETPSVGGVIETEEFKAKYIGKKLDTAVDAVTGATNSSNAVTRGVDKALKQIKDLMEGGGNND